METNTIFTNFLIALALMIPGSALTMLVIRLVAGPGLVLKLVALTFPVVLLSGLFGFLGGQIGFQPGPIIVIALLGTVLTTGMYIVLYRWILVPIQQLIGVGKQIAGGDLRETVDFSSSDEIGQLAGVLRETIAYQREMAEAATRLSQGDVNFDVTPQSQFDVLGDAFTQMVTYQQQMASTAALLAEGDLRNNITPRSENDALGNAFSQMVTYQQQMAGTAAQLAGGDLRNNITPRSENDALGNAFGQMVTYQQHMAGAAALLAEGDLRSDITPRSENDALGSAFSQMLVNLRQLISQVQQSAEQVSEASQQLSQASDQAGQASQQVADTIQQIVAGTNQQTISTSEATSNLEQVTRAAEGIARGAQEQAGGVQKTSELIDVMATLVSQTQETTQLVSTANGKVTAAAQLGVTVIEQTNQGMETIRQRAAITAEKIRDMSDRSKEIGRIVETIDDIADKTDMLALNAAVEAARAGEHGRGFAVVAEQVRKLSEDSKNATRDIDKLIERVQEGIGEATAAMASTVEEVNKGAQLTADTDRALRQIMQAAEEAVLKFNQISEAMNQMTKHNQGVVSAIESVSTVVEENSAVAEELSANSQEVADAMETVVSVAEENSAATEEASASTEELSAQVEEVVAAAKELADLADALRDSTRQFQLQDDGQTVNAGGRDNGQAHPNGRRGYGLARAASANGGV